MHFPRATRVVMGQEEVVLGIGVNRKGNKNRISRTLHCSMITGLKEIRY